jgi:hypothetical protein
MGYHLIELPHSKPLLFSRASNAANLNDSPSNVKTASLKHFGEVSVSLAMA